jgi:hypothetical protein
MPLPARVPLSRFLPVIVLLVAACTAPPAARAHGVGMSQLQLHVDGSQIAGEWDLDLHDARLALGLDPQLSGEAGWADLRAHESQYRALLSSRLALTADGHPCAVVIIPAPVEWQARLSTVRVHLAASCPAPPARLGLHCDLLFDRQPTHRAYFSVEDARVTSVGAMRADQRSVTVDVHQFHLGEVLLEFVHDGVWHIWTGPDHILFLLALLLPAALVRSGESWLPRIGLWPTGREVMKVVTAFTLAHSLTLALACFGVVTVPSNWVETGIAISVFAAAWNNLRPFLPGRAWAMAMSFGLVHGLGFAGALNNLALPRHARGIALTSFNVGVEVGQLVIVAVALPLLYAGSRRNWYPRLVMGLGSLAIAWLAVVWSLQRGLGLDLHILHARG